MDNLTEVEKLKADIKKLEAENRRWEETQADKIDAKSSNAINYYVKEREAAIRRFTNREQFCIDKIKEYTEELKQLKIDNKDYLESSSATIERLSKNNIIKPERIRRNDDNIKDMKRRLSLLEMNMSNLKIVESRPAQPYIPMTVIWDSDEPVGLRPSTPPSDIWKPKAEHLDAEAECARLRACFIPEPEF